MIFSYHISNAQYSIKGTITDQNNLPLSGATVFLPELNKGTVSDSKGQYQLANLPKGKATFQYSYLGFANKIETIIIDETNIELNITLIQTTIETEEIVITGGFNSSQHENAVKIDVLKLTPQTLKSSPNFAALLTKVSGVDMISKGSGVSKPVIRGLSMNDILVLNNGVRFENYQYSSHHPLGIDEFGNEEVEIIKGPASLLYGSDAIGGVINFIKEKPAPVETIIGDYNLQLFSNSLGMTNNLGIKGSSKSLFWGFRVGQKTNSDYLYGGGKFVPNSRFNEYSVKTNVGFSGKVGTFKLFYDYNKQNLGLVEDEPIQEITRRGRQNEIFYQRLNTHLLSSQNKIYWGKIKLEVNSAYQNTELIHFGEADVYEIQMNLATLTYDTKIHLPSNENSEYIIGFQGFNQINKNLNNRETKLLPDATTNNNSALGLAQYTFLKKLKVQAGIRYDFKQISSKAVSIPDSSDYRSPLEKSYSSFSGSIGATYNLTESLLFRVNAASAYRTPNLAELTSNGQHEAIYEVGDNNLKPENSYEIDLSMHYHTDNFMFDLAGFYNTINNYIFISPTGSSTMAGVPIYRYMQSNSHLAGGEMGIHFHPKSNKWLHTSATFSSVTGKQGNGSYLPFIPAHKLNFEVMAEAKKVPFMNKAFISVSSNTAFRQNNAAPDETRTNGYTLFNLTVGGNIKTNNQNISISLSANNIFDLKYIDHLSTLKEVNLYNPGRNISLSLSVPFGLK